jgi:outer membrane protein assembly factor BamB
LLTDKFVFSAKIICMKITGLILTFLVFAVLELNAQDWPDWRGPNRDGIWNETGIIEKFDSNKIDIKWKVPIGPGYSGPTVSKGKVYVTDRQTNPEAERVVCFDEQTGAKIWEYKYNCIYEGVGYPTGPRASVIINEGKAYSLGTMGNLFCFDAISGKILWAKDLNKEYEIRMPIWGISAAPLVVNEKIILQIGGSNNACVIVLNKNSGKEIWRNLNDGVSYSAPVLIEQAGKKEVVVWTEDNLSGLDLETGKLYWEIPWKIKMAMAIVTPVVYKNYIFTSSFYSGSILVKLNPEKLTAEKVWQRQGANEQKTDALHCVMSTPIILDDYIYGVDSYGQLRCLELSTGNRVWENQTAVKKDRWANIHLVQNGKQTWMFNEHGELIISELSPKGFKEISRAKLIEPTREQLPRGVTWSHPAFANKFVFARNDRELVCARLARE